MLFALIQPLDRNPLCQNAVTCRRGGELVISYNRLRDFALIFCHQAHFPARLEARSGLTPGLDHTCPADVLVRDWTQASQLLLTSPSHLLSPLLFWLRQILGLVWLSLEILMNVKRPSVEKPAQLQLQRQHNSLTHSIIQTMQVHLLQSFPGTL